VSIERDEEEVLNEKNSEEEKNKKSPEEWLTRFSIFNQKVKKVNVF